MREIFKEYFMKEMLWVYKIIIWSAVSLLALFFEAKFISFFIRDVSAGKDIFIPGVLILMLGVSVAAVFSVTRVIKYVKFLGNKNKNNWTNKNGNGFEYARQPDKLFVNIAGGADALYIGYIQGSLSGFVNIVSGADALCRWFCRFMRFI